MSESKAIGTMYLHNREEVNGFVATMKKAEELYSKAEEMGLTDITLDVGAHKYSSGKFLIKIEASSDMENLGKEEEES